ncbi:MAG: hypothetical protein ACOX17_00690 [Christensenellales bacterium]|jgi:hypothetical protein
MKKTVSLILSLILVLGMSACFFGKKEGAGDVAGNKSETAGEAAENLDSEDPGGESDKRTTFEEAQAKIPEEYRLKVNIPADWNEPLPPSEDDFASPLFGIGNLVGTGQQDNGEPVDYPDAEELFTIEEIEEYFGMMAEVEEKSDLYIMENSTSVTYKLYKSEPSSSAFADGIVDISLEDWGSPTGASSTMSMIYGDDKELEGFGTRAYLKEFGGVAILVDTAILHIDVELEPPGGGPKAPADEEFMLKFSHFVYDRLMEKMKKTE